MLNKVYKVTLISATLIIFMLMVGCSSQLATTVVSNEIEKVNYFENLSITDVNIIDEGGWKKIMGKITNNNTVNVDGYVQVVFYDSSGKMVDSDLIDLPIGGINSGGTAAFSESATKSDFESYEFFNSTVRAIKQ